MAFMKFTLFFCLGVFESMCQPIASGKWSARDSLGLRRSEDSSNKLPPMMYFGSRRELPPTLYSGDVPKDNIKLPPIMHAGWPEDNDVAVQNERKEVSKNILGNKLRQIFANDATLLRESREGDIEEEQPRKMNAGWRVGDSLREAPPRIHSGWRAGDAPSIGAQEPKAHAGWRAGDTSEDMPPRLHSGWRSGDSLRQAS